MDLGKVLGRGHVKKCQQANTRGIHSTCALDGILDEEPGHCFQRWPGPKQLPCLSAGLLGRQP